MRDEEIRCLGRTECLVKPGSDVAVVILLVDIVLIPNVKNVNKLFINDFYVYDINRFLDKSVL